MVQQLSLKCHVPAGVESVNAESLIWLGFSAEWRNKSMNECQGE